MRQLDQEIGQRTAKLERLTARRDHQAQRLGEARKQYAALEAEIRQLDTEITRDNRGIFVLLGELDHLRTIQQRVHQRATVLADRKLAPEGVVDPNRRSHSRSPLVVEVNVHGENNFYVGFSQDISEGGLFVATHATSKVGQRFAMEFGLPGSGQPIRCMVEVAWVSDSHGAGMGLRFIGLTESARQSIEQFQRQREPLFFPELDDL